MWATRPRRAASPAGWGFWSDGGVGPARCRRRGAPVRLSPVPTRLRPFRPVSARPAPSSLVPSRPGPFFARPGSLLPALDRAVSSHLCQPPVRLCPSCPAPLSLSVRDGVFLPALDRAAPAHLCQPPVRLRPSPPAPACPAPFPPATECFCQPLTGLLRPTFVNLLSVSARPGSSRPPFRPLRPAFGCFYPHRSFRAGAVPLPLRGRAASRGAEVPAKTVITQNGVRERVPAGVYNLFIKIAAPRWPFGRSAVSLFTCKVSPPAPADAG